VQLSINWDPTHKRENNSQSQANLQLRREDFNSDCWAVLNCLIRGQRLTTKGAMVSGLSGHLPRRIADLKEWFNISVSKEWTSKEVNGKRTRSHIEYYMTEQERTQTMKRIIDLITPKLI
jgi:hypothetical protein